MTGAKQLRCEEALASRDFGLYRLHFADEGTFQTQHKEESAWNKPRITFKGLHSSGIKVLWTNYEEIDMFATYQE